GCRKRLRSWRQRTLAVCLASVDSDFRRRCAGNDTAGRISVDRSRCHRRRDVPPASSFSIFASPGVASMSSSEFAVDCHLHSHWPQRYPYLHPTGSRIDASNLAASPTGLFATLGSNGITHCLLIQPGAYAFDNRAMLDVIAVSKGTVKA